LGASGDEQPWSIGPIAVKEQCKFEVNQLLFRPIDLHADMPALEGEENPTFEEDASQ